MAILAVKLLAHVADTASDRAEHGLRQLFVDTNRIASRISGPKHGAVPLFKFLDMLCVLFNHTAEV